MPPCPKNCETDCEFCLPSLTARQHANGYLEERLYRKYLGQLANAPFEAGKVVRL